MASRVYLDHNATSPLWPEARTAIIAALDAGLANAGSVHGEGQRARAVVEGLRGVLLRRLGQRGDVVITGSATEANNLAIRGMKLGGGAIAVSRLEHPSVTAACEARAEADGRPLRWLTYDSDGVIDVDDLRERLRGERVALVAAMAANNELGTLQPIDAIAAACAGHGVPLHVDAAQAFGRIEVTAFPGVSSMTVASHKMGGPVGVAALWLASGVAVAPLTLGGAQERGRRAGTENVAAAAGWRAVLGCDPEQRWAQAALARDAFEHALDEPGVLRNGAGGARLGNTSNLSFAAAPFEAMLMALDLDGIACSAGSACAAGSLDPSPVLMALGVGEARVATALRFSFGPSPATYDIDDIVARVRRCWDRVAR